MRRLIGVCAVLLMVLVGSGCVIALGTGGWRCRSSCHRVVMIDGVMYVEDGRTGALLKVEEADWAMEESGDPSASNEVVIVED